MPVTRRGFLGLAGAAGLAAATPRLFSAQTAAAQGQTPAIDRQKVVRRNNPRVTRSWRFW